MIRAILVLTIAVLSAQESSNVITNTDKKLEAAIAGLRNRPANLGPKLVHAAPPASTTCSVPLKAMKIDGERHFTAKRIPAAESGAMPQVVVPAPACESVRD